MLDCGCGTGANLELLGRFGRAYGFDLTAIGLRIGREAGRTARPRHGHGGALSEPTPSISSPRSTSSIRSRSPTKRPPSPRCFACSSRAATSSINVAAMPMLSGDHSVLSHERRRYTRPSLRRCSSAPASRSSGSPTPTRRCSSRCDGARGFTSGAASPTEAEAHQEITVPPPPSTVLERAARARKPVAAGRRQPVRQLVAVSG